MEFTLFEKLAKLNWYNWMLIALAAMLVGILAVLLSKTKGEAKIDDKVYTAKKGGARALVYGALMIALSFILSYLKLFSMPQGGSITVASVLPLALYAYWFGPRYGFIGGLAAGLLQFIQKPEMVHWAQVFFDYFFAFACFGVAGFFRRNQKVGLLLGLLLGGLGRILCSTIAGAIFFASYAPENMNPWIYSIGYNLSTLGPDILIAMIVASLPAVKKLFIKLHPSANFSY